MSQAPHQQFILALDQGTTSSRAILFARDGSLRALAQQEYAQHYPQPGWVEHDADEIWQTQLAVARSVLRENNISAGQIAAVGIANQRETTVLWERASGRPLHRAIVWQDRRTADRCAALLAAGLLGFALWFSSSSPSSSSHSWSKTSSSWHNTSSWENLACISDNS